jgi:hypothetical protein
MIFRTNEWPLCSLLKTYSVFRVLKSSHSNTAEATRVAQSRTRPGLRRAMKSWSSCKRLDPRYALKVGETVKAKAVPA